MNKYTEILALSALLSSGCVIDDADRCADNLKWNELQISAVTILGAEG